MIASLNRETKEVRLVSVFRDTLLELDDGSFNKANAAYSFGGPEAAVSMLNRNLDMNIEKYVTVNFNALVDVIDALGGLDVSMTAEEVGHMNNYCVETSKVTGKDYDRIDYVIGKMPKDELSSSIEMDNAGVLPKYRGNHLQESLIFKAESIMKERDISIKYSYATVHPDNLPSLKTLEKAGYKKYKEKLMYGGKTRYIMRKELI